MLPETSPSVLFGMPAEAASAAAQSARTRQYTYAQEVVPEVLVTITGLCRQQAQCWQVMVLLGII